MNLINVNETGIREEVIKEIILLAQKYAIEKVVLFGSRARGEYHRISDIDLAVLSTARNEDLENEFIISGIIDKFFIQFEFAWKVLKELLRYEGSSIANTGSPREIIKEAYKIYEFIDEGLWLSMLKERNNMTHIYDGNEVKELVKKIIDRYIPVFCPMEEEIQNKYQEIIDIL